MSKGICPLKTTFLGDVYQYEEFYKHPLSVFCENQVFVFISYDRYPQFLVIRINFKKIYKPNLIISIHPFVLVDYKNRHYVKSTLLISGNLKPDISMKKINFILVFILFLSRHNKTFSILRTMSLVMSSVVSKI